MDLNPVVAKVTENLRARSAATRAAYLSAVAGNRPRACEIRRPRIATIASYDDMQSRDAVARSVANALSQDAADAVLCLGARDGSVPGVLIGALGFGHLPLMFGPGGPAGDAANGNHALVEVMGLHLPGAAFAEPGTSLYDALARAAAGRVAEITHLDGSYTPIADVLDERAFVNGIVGLLATGGSPDQARHLAAIAERAGIVLDRDDFDALSSAVPLLARIHLNDGMHAHHFHAAGGLAVVIRELLQAGLLHDDVRTVAGGSLSRCYTREPMLNGDMLIWRAAPSHSLDDNVLRSVASPFRAAMRPAALGESCRR